MLAGRELGHVLAGEADPARGQRLQTADRVEEGGLAGSVRADEGDDLALAGPRTRPRSTAFRPPKWTERSSTWRAAAPPTASEPRRCPAAPVDAAATHPSRG